MKLDGIKKGNLFVLILMNKFLGPTKTNPAKESPFECGSPYLQEGINPVPIKFYLVAFLFLLFDIEVVFFFPWALIFKEMGTTALIVMFAYMVVVTTFMLAFDFFHIGYQAGIVDEVIKKINSKKQK